MDKKLLLAATSALVLGSMSAIDGANAQTVAPDKSPISGTPDATAVGEVVVTATRRAEVATKVGMTITAITGATLQQERINSVEDLATVVPGLTVAKGAGVPVYTLRGIGFNTVNLASTGTVGTYVDEVAYPFPFMTSGPIFDLSRVEVLEGPQGTLYGRNTTGGLIDQITNKPTNAMVGNIQAEFGNYDTHNFEGFFNLPITDTLKARIAFRSDDSNQGWQHSISRPGDTLGRIHDLGGRAEIAWTPTDRFNLLFTANYWENHSDTEAGQFSGLLPTSTTPPIDFFLNPYYGFGTANPVRPPNSNTAADWESLGQREANKFDANGDLTSKGLPGPLVYDDQFVGLALHANYQLTPNLTLVSLTAYNYLTRNDNVDGGGVPIQSSGAYNLSGYIRSFSQELRIDGENGPVHWLAGGYYGNDSSYDQNVGQAGQSATVQITRALGAAVISPAAQAAYPGFNLNPAGITAAQVADGFTDYEFTGLYHDTTLSAFASATWDISRQWALTGGVRYEQDNLNVQTGTRDTGDGSQAAIWNTAIRYGFLTGSIGKAFGLLLGAPPPIVGIDPGTIKPGQYLTLNAQGKYNLVPIPERLNQDPVTWHVNLNYKPTDTTLFYISISDGIKSGAVPVTAANTSAQLTPVKEEELLAYEGGFKSTLFDRTVQANVSVFYYDYTNKQLTANELDPLFVVLPKLANVPKSYVYGIDWDLTWRATHDLTLGVAGTYIHSDITQFTAFNSAGALENFKGSQFSYAPAFQVSLRLLYEHPIAANTGFRLALNGSYQSESNSIVLGPNDPSAPNYRIPAYGVMNGTAGVYALDGSWQAMLWAKNLTNTYYWTNIATTIDNTARFPGMPVTFGVLLSHRF